MANARMPMRKVREILRMKLEMGLSHREVARALHVSPGLVGSTMSQAAALGLKWADLVALDEAALEERLHGPRPPPPVSARPMPDLARVHVERRRAGVTLELLHLEYLEAHPDGYRYTQFCELYRRWVKRNGLSMRQVHRAGERMFVDYSGKKPHYVDPTTGEVVEVELFVAVMGASSMSYAEASLTQQVPDWVMSHVRAFEYFGGTPALVVCDQLRSGVAAPCRYDPSLQRTYEELAAHYFTAVLPARPRRPKDKAKVEVGVQVVQRWVLARIRDRTFFSLQALNEAILELVEQLNDRMMRRLKTTRRRLFEELDRPALQPLPVDRFVYADWKSARVNIDYHIEYDHHYYSVPFSLIHEKVEVRATALTVEAFQKGQRVASHARSHARGQHSTVAEHMPAAHRAHAEWSPSRLISWAERIGPFTAALVTHILHSRPHPEQGYRPCLGILRLAKRYDEERLESACARAMAVGARSYRHVDTILKNRMDQLPLPMAEAEELPPVSHENIRGRTYYH